MRRSGVILIFVLVPVFATHAQTPLGTAFIYQGRLEDAGTSSSGLHDLQFTLYGVPAGGSIIAGPNCADNVNIVNGLFTVPLNFGAVFDGNERWLEIGVRADSAAGNCGAGAYTTLSPRQALAAAPYSLQTRGLYVDNFGRVGIGTTTPVALLNIDGGLILDDVLDEDVAFYTCNFYINNGDTEAPAYHYQSDPEQHEFFVGGALAMKIASNGNVGIGAATPLARLHVQTAASTGAGVFAYATDRIGVTSGGRFQCDSLNGFGVYAVSDGGTGVYGVASATGGTTYGGQFQSAGVSGRGVSGLSSAATGTNYGVRGESESMTGRGVYGLASATTGTNYGVRGQTSSLSGYGVYSVGELGASGVKSFRIDHPSDPENKYLLHYSTESPFPQNFYSGNVVTDTQGRAWVDLPAYFAEVNANFKYQLTVVEDAASATFVQVKIGRKISENRFLVMSSAPNVEVSWRVEADRNDRYVRLKQPKDVIEKQDPERGAYQHPELYGAPEQRGMDFDAERDRTSQQTGSESTPN